MTGKRVTTSPAFPFNRGWILDETARLRSYSAMTLLRSLILTFLFACSSALGASGILELDSKPGGAEVFVDGKKKGITPETEGQKLTMELAEGDHEIVIKKEGVGSATKTIFIGEGVIQPLTLTIQGEAFTNPLGMKFVPVPGTQILMCIHETRNRDYAAYAAENSGVDMEWQHPVFKWELSEAKKAIKDVTLRRSFDVSWDDRDGLSVAFKELPKDNPVLCVSWNEANAFCSWLGTRDGKVYRLPTDHEWSCAVGIGHRENSKETPAEKHGKLGGVFPWGAGFPPSKHNVGNYRDSLSYGRIWLKTDFVGYDDGYPITAPVMSYSANQFGVFDLGGNVDEWCDDKWDSTSDGRVHRGGNWGSSTGSETVSSSSRSGHTPDYRMDTVGFRCVVVVGSSSP